MKITNKIIITFLLLLSTTSVYSITSTEAAQSLSAVGYITTTSNALKKATQHCTKIQPSFMIQANQAFSLWLKNNKKILNHSEKIYQFVLNDIRTSADNKTAEDFARDSQSSSEKAATAFIKQMSSRGNEKTIKVCQKLIDSIIQNEWDISKRNPKAYQKIMNVFNSRP